VAGVALRDMDRHFAWQAWHSATSIVTLRGRQGTSRPGSSLCVAGALMALGGALGPPPPFAWKAWHFATSIVTLHDRRGPYGTGLAPVARWAAVGAVVAAAVCVAGLALGDIDRHFAWQAWHFATWIVTLRGR